MFLSSILDFKHINVKFSEAASTKFLRHLWYLGEDLVALSFFDERIPSAIKIKMVQAIKNRQSTTENTKKLWLKQEGLKSFGSKDISDFVTQKSMVLFEKFGLSTSFLDLPVDQWEFDVGYQGSVEIVRSIKVVNDVAERAVVLIDKYKDSLTCYEDQKQFLL